MKKLTAQEFEMAFSEHEKDCRKCRTKICNYNSKNFNCLQEKDLAVYQELKEYRKAEEEGSLIILPYKVGEEVWTVCSNVTYGEIGDPPEVHYYVAPKTFTFSLYVYARDNIFASKEEAEKRKGELKNGKTDEKRID